MGMANPIHDKLHEAFKDLVEVTKKLDKKDLPPNRLAFAVWAAGAVSNDSRKTMEEYFVGRDEGDLTNWYLDAMVASGHFRRTDGGDDLEIV